MPWSFFLLLNKPLRKRGGFVNNRQEGSNRPIQADGPAVPPSLYRRSGALWALRQLERLTASEDQRGRKSRPTAAAPDTHDEWRMQNAEKSEKNPGISAGAGRGDVSDDRMALSAPAESEPEATPAAADVAVEEKQTDATDSTNQAEPGGGRGQGRTGRGRLQRRW